MLASTFSIRNVPLSFRGLFNARIPEWLKHQFDWLLKRTLAVFMRDLENHKFAKQVSILQIILHYWLEARRFSAFSMFKRARELILQFDNSISIWIYSAELGWTRISWVVKSTSLSEISSLTRRMMRGNLVVEFLTTLSDTSL